MALVGKKVKKKSHSSRNLSKKSSISKVTLGKKKKKEQGY